MPQTVGGEADEVHGLYLSVSQFARDFDPASVSPADAKRIMKSAARAKSVLGVIESLALLRIDETEAYKADGYRSAADYGAAQTGSKPGDAQRAMKAAKRAKRLPNTDEAMRRGDLSSRQADAITDAASVNAEAEDDLLASAKVDDVGTLERKAKRAKFSADRDAGARTRRIHARRSLRHWTDEEGAFHAHLRTTAEAGARLLAGLEPHRTAAFDHARRTGRREAPDAYLADALDALARGASPDPAPAPAPVPSDRADDRAPSAPPPGESSGRDPSPGGGDAADSEPTSTPTPAPRDATCEAPATPTSPPPTAVKLNIDFAPLVRGKLEPGDICEIPGVGPVSLDEARALLSDAVIDLIVKKGDDIRSVVHYGRNVTAAQRRAIEARDPCCIRPGCGRTQNLQIDHRDGWAITHETSLDELARLCNHDHDLKTHHGHTYRGGPGTWRWHTPDDPPPAVVDEPGDPPLRPDGPDAVDQPGLFDTG